MSASIITFADLGKRENLKTASILPFITLLHKKGELKQVICRINKGFSFKNTFGAIPILLHYGVHLLGRVPFLPVDARLVEEDIFDMRAAHQLQKTDVAFFHYDYLAPKTIRVAKAQGAVTVGLAVTAHLATNARLESEELERLGGTGAGDLHYHKRLARLNRGEAPDYLIAQSEFVKETYAREGFVRERIFVAPVDVDMERFHPAETPYEGLFTVVYVAQTTILKGLQYLLEAWSDVSIPNARLIIAGGYSDMPLSLAQRYDEIIRNNKSIEYIPFEKNPEELYRRASVMVLPSLTEGFGRATLEAMACGTPVITTENARGIVEDGVSGFVVPIRDSQALKEKIEYFSKNESARSQMGIAAREAALRKPSFAQSAYAIYEQICKQGNK